MRSLLSFFGVRFSTGHAVGAAVLIPACILVFAAVDLLWLGVTLAVLIGLAALVTVRGRRVTGWLAALFAWRRRHRQPRRRRRKLRSARPSSRPITSPCGGTATTWCRSSNWFPVRSLRR